MDAKLLEEEIERRRQQCYDMLAVECAVHDTGTWRYAVHVAPVYVVAQRPDLLNRDACWRVELHGESREGRTRIESFDIATMRAYCALFTEVLRQYDAGEIREPWEPR